VPNEAPDLQGWHWQGVGALLPTAWLPGCAILAGRGRDSSVLWPQSRQSTGLVTWGGLEKPAHVLSKGVKTGEENTGKSMCVGNWRGGI